MTPRDLSTDAVTARLAQISERLGLLGLNPADC